MKTAPKSEIPNQPPCRVQHIRQLLSKMFPTQQKIQKKKSKSDSDDDWSHAEVATVASANEEHDVAVASNNDEFQRWDIHESVIDVIGSTPIIKLNKLYPKIGVDIYAKCENLNPGGSVKDRLAMGVIEWAERTGTIQPGQTVIEASSGNTGVGLAMVCAAKGYPFVCVMSENYSTERRVLMRFLGARVILTKAEYKATGMLIKAQELADKHGFFHVKQFENEANAWIHEQTTGLEIVRAFQKKNIPLNHFFMSYGTGGTMLGISRALRKSSPKTRIHMLEPTNAPMLSSGIPTNYPENGIPHTSFDTAHPAWSPHKLQGWATDFIPKLTAMAQEEKAFDQIHLVSGGDAINMSKELAKKEGLFVGISGGGMLSAAIKYAEGCSSGTSILCVLPDTGERYLSTELFENIPIEMTEEEQLLSNSTPSHPPPPPPHLHGILPANTDDLFDL